MTYDFKLSCILPALPQRPSTTPGSTAPRHSAMTGAQAKIGKRVGERLQRLGRLYHGQDAGADAWQAHRAVVAQRPSSTAKDPEFDDRRRARADEDGHAADA